MMWLIKIMLAMFIPAQVLCILCFFRSISDQLMVYVIEKKIDLYWLSKCMVVTFALLILIYISFGLSKILYTELEFKILLAWTGGFILFNGKEILF